MIEVLKLGPVCVDVEGLSLTEHERGRLRHPMTGMVILFTRNYSSCDSLLLGSDCGAHTFPYMDAHNDTAVFEHEATTSKISG